jgi:hypothetical protein
LVTFDATVFNISSAYSTSTGRFTAPFAGDYIFNAGTGFPIGSGGAYGLLSLYKNGTEYHRGQEVNLPGNNDTQLGMAVLVRLAANDYVQIYVQSGAGGALQVGNTVRTYFNGGLFAKN